jgi:hypothetical protein
MRHTLVTFRQRTIADVPVAVQRMEGNCRLGRPVAIYALAQPTADRLFVAFDCWVHSGALIVA